jgi:hypothetical protein
MFGFKSKDLVFYTYQFFNFDQYPKKGIDFSNPKYAGKKHLLAEGYFRIFLTSIEHKRRFKSILDWFAIISGFFRVIIFGVTVLVGGFLSFT